MKNTAFAYRMVAFTAGFVLMTFELVAARMLAPTIGTSTFVWTNVLGIIMAALAAGYYLGGKLADKRKEELDIVWLLFAVAATVIFVLVAGDSVISLGLALFKDARWQGMFVAFFLFAAPSLLLGMLSPYLAKFAITSTKTSANSVAGLSTANAVGSILGTFLTGFVLFGLIGGHVILLALIVIMLAASWLVAPSEIWKVRAVVCGLAVMMALLPALKTDGANGATIDTASARYIVKQGPYRDGREVTMLIAGPKGVQSAIYTDGSRELVFWYQQQMAEVVGKMFAEQDEFKVLILGGGAFTMPDYLARQYPNAQVDVVEIDPTLFEIAKEHFGMEDLPNMNVYAEDARSFVRHSSEKYDFILVDVSYDIAMPWQFVTREFGDAVAGLLKDDGLMAVNMLASEVGGCSKMYDAVYGIYARHLPNRYMVRYESGAEVVTNTELFFSRKARPELGLTALDKKIGVTYTDSFAPIEHLLLSCHR